MNILLTNDDGFDAPGLAVLAGCFDDDATIWVAAPTEAQSGIGHRVTTRDPIRVTASGPMRFRIAGTPADCVRIGLKRLCPNIDWVVAGINPGANLGSDVYQSGTVAAAREGAILGTRGIALSQYISRDGAIDWETTGRLARVVLRRVMALDLPSGCYWNVNFPHPLAPGEVPAVARCGLDPLPHKYDFRPDGDHFVYEGTIHERPRLPGRDVDVCFSGNVSLTRCALETDGNGRAPR